MISALVTGRKYESQEESVTNAGLIDLKTSYCLWQEKKVI